MRLLYRPTVNRLARTMLRPFSQLIPEHLRFPVTGQIRVCLEGDGEIVMACNPTSYLAKVLFWKGVRGFEYNLYRVFVELARSAGTFLDVGANIGYYTLVASAVNGAMKIASFEPLPAAYLYLVRNLELNGCRRVSAEMLALSNTEGTARFFVSKNPKYLFVDHQLTSTGGLDRETATRSDLVEELTVRTTTMDRYVSGIFRHKIDLLKLDTEASEHLVLAGAETVLSEHRPMILCEVLPGRIEEELFAIFRRFDYRCFRAEHGGLSAVDSLSHDRTTVNDHIMAPAERAHELSRFLKSG